LEDVSPERIRDELFRMLDGEKPWNAIRLMDALGILPFVLPEIKKLQGVQQSPPHFNDVFDHSLFVMQKLGELLQTLGLEHEPEEGQTGLWGCYRPLGAVAAERHLSGWLDRSDRRTLIPGALS
jgi:tRNA nucleotidyltransferase/poly(A) polymerase